MMEEQEIRVPLSFKDWFLQNEDRFFWIENEFDNLTLAEEQELDGFHLRYIRDFYDEQRKSN